MEVAERERQVRRFVDEVWNGRNYEAAADLYGENYVNSFGAGPSARVEPIRRYHQAFSDLHLDQRAPHRLFAKLGSQRTSSAADRIWPTSASPGSARPT